MFAAACNVANMIITAFFSVGKNAVYCGESGAGQATKIVNNMLLGIHMIGVGEAMNLGVK